MAALACVLSLRGLALGYQADDHGLVAARLSSELPAWALWSVPPAELGRRREVGFFAWWASPRLEIAFLRPLSSLSHSLELALFPHRPSWMLLVNVLIYAAIVCLSGLLYRRLMRTATLGALAGLMFTVSGSHAASVGWIAGRNTLLACLFSLAGLLSHIDARASGRRDLSLPSTSCVAAALLSAEAGVWALAFLIAYAAVLEERPWRDRVRSVLPQLAVGAVWAAVYLAGGFGLRGASWYRDLSDPLGVLAQGILDMPLWATTLFGPPIVFASIAVPAETARWAALPFAVLALAALASVLRSSKECRFFALLTLLCVLPLFPTLPQDRVTLGATFGAFGWLACFVHETRAGALRVLRWARHVFLALHVWLALLAFPLLLGSTQPVERAVRALHDALPATAQVVLLNAPVELLHMDVLAMLDIPGAQRPPPESFHLLYSGASRLTITRPDARTLELQASRGWGHVPVERVFCALQDLPRRGERRTLEGMRAHVLESTPDGRPARVRFTFDSALEDARRSFLVWRGRAPAAWTPVAVGEHAQIESRGILTGLPL